MWLSNSFMLFMEHNVYLIKKLSLFRYSIHVLANYLVHVLQKSYITWCMWKLQLCIDYITWWNSSANLLWRRVYVPHKWHFLYKPFSNPEDSWTHPRRHKYSNKKYKHQGGQEPKAWNNVKISCHEKIWIQERESICTLQIITIYHVLKKFKEFRDRKSVV